MIIDENISQNSQLRVMRAVELLGVSKSGFYKWKQRQNHGSQPFTDDADIKEEIEKIVVEFPGYGYRRVTAELKRRGYHVNHKKVHKLMKEGNLLCTRKKFKPLTTDSSHDLRKYPNLIKNLEITGLNQVWASDITYIKLIRDYLYLAVILDLFSRKCIGWELGRNLDTRLTMNALKMALENRWNENLQGLIHHSDQGVQYASREYVECLEAHGIRISMSHKGNPYDNAYVESFIGTLKQEEVYLNEYETSSDAQKNIGRFIEDVYNRKRLHSSLGYKSPEEFEKEVTL